jgi:hypothetical protein
MSNPNPNRIENLPGIVQEVIEEYFNLEIANQKVKTPYFRNVKRVRAELRSLSGKGTADEIVEEVLIYAKLRGVSLSSISDVEIRDFMESQGLGIDCSGFVAYILDALSRELTNKSLSRHIQFPKASIYRRVIRRIRFIENTSAQILTDENNCQTVTLAEIKPGDLIRLKGHKRGDHVAVVSEVEYEENLPIRFKYAHSSPHYDKQNGVRIGEVEVVDSKAELKDQRWLEFDENGRNWTYEELEKEYEDNGLRRPNFMISKK